MWFFVVAPPALALLFDPHCARTPDNVLRAWLALFLFTGATGVAIHVTFERLAQRVTSLPTGVQLALHALSTILVVGAMTFLLHGVVRFVYPEVGDDVLDVLWRAIIVSFAYLATARFVGRLQEKAVAERTAALEARLASLQAQMQPHFLFNSLNVCAGLVHSAPEVAEAILDQLAAFLRYTIESSEHRLVPLERELDAMSAYLAIQRERFGERLRHEIVAPLPDEPALKAAALQVGLSPASAAGMTIGYAVVVRRGYETSTRLLSHEFRHVAQYEASGGIRPFLAVHLADLAAFGYEDSPFEVDARAHERDGAPVLRRASETR